MARTRWTDRLATEYPRQVSYLRSLLEDRDHAYGDVDWDTLTAGQASAMIDLLKTMRRRYTVDTSRADVQVAQTFDGATIQEFIGRAATRIRRPGLTVGLPEGGVLVMRKNSRGSRIGSLTLTDDGDYGSNAFYGWIHPDGRWEPSRRQVPDQIVTALSALAADPEGFCREHGWRTGRCCFCNRPLSDERSTAEGYGPQCAQAYGLPWGGRVAMSNVERVLRDRVQRTVADLEAAGEVAATREEARGPWAIAVIDEFDEQARDMRDGARLNLSVDSGRGRSETDTGLHVGEYQTGATWTAQWVPDGTPVDDSGSFLDELAAKLGVEADQAREAMLA